MTWIKKLLARFLNWISGGWFGEGTDDDWRNPFWRWTEHNHITVTKSMQYVDFRFGYKRLADGKWIWWDNRPVRTWVAGKDANFYNGIFTYSETFTWGIDRDGNEVSKDRFNLVIRLFHSWWFAFGVGCLPDRGEFGWTGPWFFSYEGQVEHNPDVISPDHLEGAV